MTNRCIVLNKHNGYFATLFSKAFNLAMLTRAAIAPPTVVWRAAWDNTSQPAQLICCATVLVDYSKILLFCSNGKKSGCQEKVSGCQEKVSVSNLAEANWLYTTEQRSSWFAGCCNLYECDMIRNGCFNNILLVFIHLHSFIQINRKS